MKNFLSVSLCVVLILFSCKKEEKNQAVSEKNKTELLPETVKAEAPNIVENVVTKKNPKEFIPKGFVFFEEINGDLNNDGLKDCVLVIKAIEKDKVITDEYRGKLDRNRRGIIILFQNKNGGYELITQNNTCFSSENEDGGVYYAPELVISIDKNNLYVEYLHGRYGYWHYTFKHKSSDFQLIGYDSSDNRGPLTNGTTSINFLTGKKQQKINTNQAAEEEGEEVFKETWTKIDNRNPVFLSQIKDFDELSFN